MIHYIFFSAFSLGKRKLLSALCPSVRPSVTASSLQGVVGLGWFIACLKAYEPRIWIMMKKFLGIDSGRGQEGLKSLTLYIFLEYLWTFYKCVCVRKREIKYVYVCECVCVWERERYSVCNTFKFHIIIKLWVCENRFLCVCVFVFHNIMKLWECVIRSLK
jgi:hypothetical protein